VKQQRRNWNGPTANSVLCSKHFETACFALEGSCYQDAAGIPTKKRLKPDAIPTIFPKSIYGGSSGPSAPSQRPTSEKRQCKAVSILKDASTHSYNKKIKGHLTWKIDLHL